ncbi:MAG: hypothetical protein JNJ46_35025 [Myxococcales bacterium]|nr:hypothetical protein [Myxococcales bacterium]
MAKMMGKSNDLDKAMAQVDSLINTQTGEQRALMERDTTRIQRFKSAVLAKESKAHRVAVDFGGGVAAQVSMELLNWGIRAVGRWSKDGFWANNVDLLQGAPHFVLGLGVYFAEMLTRNEPKGGGEWITPTREVVSEAAKIFGQLGFSNLVRAMRVRWGDAKARDVALAAVVQEKAALEQKLAALQAGKAG